MRCATWWWRKETERHFERLKRFPLGYLVPVAPDWHERLAILDQLIGIRCRQAAPEFPPGCEIGRRIVANGDEIMRRARASEGYLLAGRIDEARDTAFSALGFSEQNGHRPVRGFTGYWETSHVNPSLLRNGAEHHYREPLLGAGERRIHPLAR